MVRRLATDFTRKRAKELRKEPPRSEAVLWQLVRRKQIAGCKFHRRAVVLGSIPDFWCPAAKLALEIDESSSEWKRFRDAERDKRFAAEGIRTMHIPARRLFHEPHRLVEELVAAVLERKDA
jgi:very-short-patch-repair endonuclease